MADDKRGKFESTRWSMIRAAGWAATPEARKALEELCAIYWYPVYVFFRRQRGAEDARDLTQGFFARLVEKNDVAAADPERGKFRNWLLASAAHYRQNDEDRARAQKRGGGQALLSIDFADAEGRYGLEPASDATPELTYEKRWALTLLDRVFQALGREYDERGRAALFEKLRLCLIGWDDEKHLEMARELGMDANTFNQNLRRCRHRFGALLRDEVAQTVSTEAEMEEEIRHLLDVVSR